MVAFAVVIDLDKPKNHCSCLLNYYKIMLVHILDFEGVEEALTNGIVKAIAFTAHSGFELVGLDDV